MLKKDSRRGLLFGFATIVALTTMASAAFACVAFKGTMTAVGADGQTTVTGSGPYHEYCTGGAPTTAAAGGPGTAVSVSVAPAPASSLCADKPTKPNRLRDGKYEVRLNREIGYRGADVDLGGAWLFQDLTGCFASWNSSTTTTLGTFTISDGSGTASIQVNLAVDPNDPPPTYTNSGPTDAAVFCVGPSPENQSGDGMLAPFQLTPIVL